jgi:copper(I)-binding protein
MACRHLFAAAAAAILATAAAAHEYALGPLAISHPYAIETPRAAKTGAGYLSITNNGDAPDRLLSIRTAFPRTEIHTVEVGADGVTRMRPLEALDIPPGATVTLAPEGLHVMFMGLTEPLAEGTSIPATLVFERGGEIAIEFKVEPRGSASDPMQGMTH